MSTPNWPIEIGAIYKETQEYLTLAGSRVINIDGDNIHYEYVTKAGYDRESPTRRNCQADIFRALHRPLDISPIAALYTYIERVTKHLGDLPGEYAEWLTSDGLKLLEARKSLITEIE